MIVVNSPLAFNHTSTVPLAQSTGYFQLQATLLIKVEGCSFSANSEGVLLSLKLKKQIWF